VSDEARLRRLAEEYESKYGSDWHFDVRDGAFAHEGGVALVYEVAPVKAFGFRKGDEFSQTRWRFRTGVQVQPSEARGSANAAAGLACTGSGSDSGRNRLRRLRHLGPRRGSDDVEDEEGEVGAEGRSDDRRHDGQQAAAGVEPEPGADERAGQGARQAELRGRLRSTQAR
jgi:hypothetical protein